MKSVLRGAFAALLFCMSFGAFAQEIYVPYIPTDKMTDVVQCIPAPPQDPSTAFDYDILRYMWGKQQRKDPERLAMAVRDAIWSLDTTLVILGEPFGLKVSKESTPAIYEVLTRGVTTIENIRYKPKAHYFRIRPFAYFKEPSIFPQDDEWLATEGSYPSGHTIRAWACALLMAQINPATAEAVFARAWESGQSRVISGCHWQSDVDASRPVASIGYAQLQTSDVFQRQMALAREELRRLTTIPVMSFNVRYGTAPDGDNDWDNRKDAACAMIRDQRPAVFGVQEALGFQLDYILEHCPGYACVGVGREDGAQEGEHMAVFYDTERIDLLKWGTYWLSETPDVPSLGWDAACRRTATWTYLYDNCAKRKFYFVNTHLDHVGQEARRNGLLLLVKRIGAMNPEGCPMVLTGDMNVYPDDPCLKELRDLMKDARQTATVTDTDQTYHAWGTVSGNPPIDYVFYNGFAGCPEFKVIRQPYEGVRFISDHYPVMATLGW